MALRGRRSSAPPAFRTDAVARVEDSLRRNTPASVAEAVAIGSATESLVPRDLVRLAGRFLVTGHPGLARDLVEEAERRNPADLSDGQRGRLQHLRAWTHPTAWPEPPPDAVQVGVFRPAHPHRGRPRAPGPGEPRLQRW
jgi:hypothetical protein